MAPEGFLRAVLADGARPFRYRAGVRELLGAPDDNGVRISFASALPRGGFRYVRQRAAAPQPQDFDMPGWLAETDDFEVAETVAQVTAPPTPVATLAFLDEPRVTAMPSSLVTEVMLPPDPTTRRADPPAAVWPEVLSSQSESAPRRVESRSSSPVVEQPRTAEPDRGVATVAVSAVAPTPARPTSLATVPPEASRPAIQPATEPAAAPSVPESVRAMPARQRLSAQPFVVRSVDAPNRPPHRQSANPPAFEAPQRQTADLPVFDASQQEAVELPVFDAPCRRPVDLPLLDAPYRRPAAVETPVPAPVEPPQPTPAAAPPRLVVVRAPAPVEEEPAFWERRQLGRLVNRITR